MPDLTTQLLPETTAHQAITDDPDPWAPFRLVPTADADSPLGDLSLELLGVLRRIEDTVTRIADHLDPTPNGDPS